MLWLSYPVSVAALITLTLCCGSFGFSFPDKTKIKNRETNGKQCVEFLCGTDNEPVCGSDGITYPNSCKFSQARCRNPNLVISSQGACGAEPQYQGQGQNPGLGQFPNQGQYPGQGQFPNQGQYPDQSQYPGYDQFGNQGQYPVQGQYPTQGQYPNQGQFPVQVPSNGNENCLAQIPDSPVSVDPCSNLFCGSQYEPICASDGRTYGNECRLTTAQCRNPRLTPVYKGECKGTENSNDGSINLMCLAKVCPAEDKYLCASDRMTYRNICEFEKAKCIKNELHIVREGVCIVGMNEKGRDPSHNNPCEWTCENNFQPVCGTNKQIYANTCNFGKAQCRDRALKILKFGPCQ